jgi:hypothetical protein
MSAHERGLVQVRHKNLIKKKESNPENPIQNKPS